MNSTFVSRGGDKLSFALKHFEIEVNGLICADFGSSKGGFVDCLLQCGAKKVYSVDTSYGELDWKLRNDPRVIVLERTNALHVQLPELVDFISVDVSWTKQGSVMPNVLINLKSNGEVISLLKPHYESDPKFIKKGLLEEVHRNDVVNRVSEEISKFGNLKLKGIVESPILGSKGKNAEFLLFLQKV